MREPLVVTNETRNDGRDTDSWGTNCLVEAVYEKVYAVKRFGLSAPTAGASPGQGLFSWNSSIVKVQNDVLKVGASSYTL